MDKLALLAEILTQNPNDAFARYGLAMEHAAQGNTEAAFAEFEKLLAANPDYVPGHQMYAQTLAKAGRTADAVAQLNSGIAAAQRTGNQHALSEMEGMLDELSG